MSVPTAIDPRLDLLESLRELLDTVREYVCEHTTNNLVNPDTVLPVLIKLAGFANDICGAEALKHAEARPFLVMLWSLMQVYDDMRRSPVCVIEEGLKALDWLIDSHERALLS